MFKAFKEIAIELLVDHRLNWVDFISLKWQRTQILQIQLSIMGRVWVLSCKFYYLNCLLICSFSQLPFLYRCFVSGETVLQLLPWTYFRKLYSKSSNLAWSRMVSIVCLFSVSGSHFIVYFHVSLKNKFRVVRSLWGIWFLQFLNLWNYLYLSESDCWCLLLNT